MLRKLKTLILPPVFSDQEMTRVARIAHYISGSLFILFLIPLIYNLSVNLLNAALILVTEEIILAATFLLNIKGKNRASTTLLSFSMPVMASFLIVTSLDGVHDIALLIYPASLVVGGLLLERKSFIAYTGFTIVAVCLIFLAELNGVSHARLSSYVSYQDLTDAILIIVITAFLVNLLTKNLLKNIELSRQNQNELGIMNEELKKYSALLKTSEEKFRFITDHINDLVAQVSPQGIFIYTSPSYEAILGYKPDELEGKHFSTFVKEDKVEALNDSILEAIRTRKNHIRAEVWINHRNGTPILFDANISFIYTENGSLERLQVVSRDITLQRKSAEELKKSAQEWQNTFDAVHDPIFLLSTEHKIIRANKSTKTCFGVEPESALGKHCWEVVHKSSTPLPECPVFKLEKTGKRASIEIQLSVNWYDVIVDPIIDDQGKLTGIVHIARDITHKKQSEQELRTEKLRLESASIAGKTALWEWDIPTSTIEWSGIIYTMLGYQPGDFAFTYNQFDSIIHPEDSARVKNAFELHFKYREPFNIDYRVRRLDNSYIWWHVVGNAQFNIDGKPYRMAGICVDITDRKQSEEALATEKERLFVTLRSIGDGVIATDINGNIIIMNTPAEEYTGWKTEEAIGRNVRDIFQLFDPKLKTAVTNPIETILDNNSASEVGIDALQISLDGTERLISARAAPILKDTKKIIGAVLVLRDITEKQRLEESIHNAEKLDSIGVLAGGIAHDFNNLLNGIFGYIELALNRGSADEKLMSYLRKAASVFERARNLTHQLFTFAKGSNPVKRTHSLEPIIRNNVNFVLSGSSITSHITIPPDILYCEIDENQINQAFDNILLNALQSMAENGIVTIKAENHFNFSPVPGKLPQCNYVCISIEDQGCGIPEQNLTRIFDPFFTTKEKGTGLGLATSYSIIKKHNGCIKVISELGKGTTFLIYLPATDRNKPEQDACPVDVYRGSGKILLMDDESYIIDLASEMIRLLGFSVLTANSGEEAVEIFRSVAKSQDRIDIVILDLTIPGGMGGRDTIKILREIDPNIKALASSGYSEDPVMADPKVFGFDGRLTKPYRKNDLSQAIAEVLK